MSIDKGSLYIVATPIGNMGDITLRAQEVLGQVNVIAVEDSRRSGQLLNKLGISSPMIALHEHNERQVCASLLQRIEQGENVALISDAGTPLLSDPGYFLVQQARQRSLRVIPVPGVSALIAALSVAGLPTDRFVFEGFLPAKATARQQRLQKLRHEPRTLIFYEAPHRIVEMIRDASVVFGPDREAVIARELTKTFETVHGDTLGKLLQWLQQDSNQQKGEFVVLIHGDNEDKNAAIDPESERILLILEENLPLKQAAALAAKITGKKKNSLYEHGLQLKAAKESS